MHCIGTKAFAPRSEPSDDRIEKKHLPRVETRQDYQTSSAQHQDSNFDVSVNNHLLAHTSFENAAVLYTSAEATAMSLDVALQSVAFYVLSCSTCAKISHKHKTKQQAKKERAEKQQLETEQPGLYRHPSPFSTNPFWNEEIMLGPGPPKRKGDKNGSKNGSSRALHTSGPGSSVVSGATSTDAGSSPTMVAADHRLSGEDWNRKRYQREDEYLWGQKPNASQHTGQKFMDALARAGNSVGITDRILGGRLGKGSASKVEEEEEEDEVGSYYIARNPPLNDLHPPIVSSQPTHKGATSWMLQPPPPAKVMEGKERANRSRSDSGASSRRGLDDVDLGRQVNSRLVAARLKRGETPEQEPSSLSLGDPVIKPKAAIIQGRDRRGRSFSDSSESESEGTMKRRRRPPPINITPPRKTKDKAEHIPIPTKPSEVTPTFRLAPATRDTTARPALATIASSSLSIPQTGENASQDPPEISAPQKQAPETSNDSTKKSSESSKEPSNVASVVIPTVHHSFQGKETFVFPPPKPSNSRHKENQSPDYDADHEHEDVA